MKFNKIVLVSILLLIFAIGAVSATDDNMTDTAEEVLSAEPTEDLEVSQPEDFSELVGLIKNTSSGKTLTLEKDYINDGTYTNGILISKKMTIDGQGHTLDANSKSNVFRISNSQVTLKNINFINSYSEDYSAVYGNCIVINCTFTDCTTGKNGGALYNGTAYNSSFINCKATYGKIYNKDKYPRNIPVPSCEGGAIYNGDAYNCYFEGCYAELIVSLTSYDDYGSDSFNDRYVKAFGGAISNGNAFNCSFKTCYIKIDDIIKYCDNNLGGGYGGAVYAGNAYDSTFIDCASWSGGAISDGDAYNCLFKSCHLIQSDWNGASGGAISNGNAYNSTFMNCAALKNAAAGGAIYNGTAYNSTFINCKADDGGAINRGNAFSCSFMNCYANSIRRGNYEYCGCGAAINFGNAYNCYFEKCSSKEGTICNGNAYDSRFIDCVSNNNEIITRGNSTNCTSNINTLVCSDLTADYGETIKSPITTVEKINGMPVTVKVYKDNELMNTFSTTTGADLTIDAVPGNYILALSCIGGNPLNMSLTINKGSPKLAFATDFTKSGETANIKVTMSKKAAGYAKITINGKTYRVQIKSGTATAEVANLAEGVYDVKAIYGGNVYHTAETITGTFQVGKMNQGITLDTERTAEGKILTATLANDATGFVRFIIDGATYRVQVENGTANLDIDNLKTGTYDVTLKYGGNYKYNAETVSQTFNIKQEGYFAELKSLVKNTSSGKTLKLEKDYINYDAGSAIAISDGITIDGQGHSIDADKNSYIFNVKKDTVVLKNINFINSYTTYHSAIYGRCTIINCTFTNCSTKYAGLDVGGGAIRNANAYNCTFTNCDADGYGGAIYHGNAYNCTFIKCASNGGPGGAIFNGKAYNCTFTDCYADYLGGAISDGSAYNSTFSNCHSNLDDGGAIYNGNAYNCTFTDCYSDNFGGAINLGNAYNCTFRECHSIKGGAISSGDAYSSIFINCSDESGEAIYDGNAYNCAFTPFTFSCSDLTVKYGEGAILPVRTAEGIDGLTVNVKIYKDGKLINSFSTTTDTDLPIDAAPGNYIIALTCDYANPLNVSLTVNKGSPKLELANNFAKSGETANVKVSISKKATGNVKITINGETYRVPISSGVASVDVANLADGAYTVKATYAGNTYHTAETMTDTFNVGLKFTQEINVSTESINVGETERITATLAKDATGFVRFIIGNDTYKVAIENGVAYVDIKDLKAGSYSVTVKYAGNYKYNAETKAASFTVSKTSPGLTVYKTTVNGKTVLTANLAEDATGYVNFAVNGGTYKAKIVNGVATLTLPDMAPGTYTLKSSYGGNYKYLPETKTRTITIK